MNSHQIIQLSKLRKEDIQASAKVMHEHGHSVHDCPYPSGSDQAARWCRYFVAMELDAAVVE